MCADLLKPYTKTPPSFQVSIRPHGPLCNLACSYCFEPKKTKFYPNSNFHMSDLVLEDFTRQYIEGQSVPEVAFIWQGGEHIFIGLDFFKLALAYQKKYITTGMTIDNIVQTNATMLDKEWCQFFADNEFQVEVSLDGPQEMHDYFRKDKLGAGTFQLVMKGIELLKKHEVNYKILTCVHAANVPYPLEVYRFLRDVVGTQGIQFLPVVERMSMTASLRSRRLTERTVPAFQYGEFLKKIFNEWVRRDIGKVYVNIFDVALSAWLGLKPGMCIQDKTCGTNLAVEHNGDLFACNYFVEPRYLLGNINVTPLVDMVSSAEQYRFGQDKRYSLPRYCRECEVRFVCNGGCPKDRVLRTPDGEPGLNYLCQGLRSFYNHIDKPMKMMASLVRNGRSPADIRQTLHTGSLPRLKS
jgi:uncharacterized protein